MEGQAGDLFFPWERRHGHSELSGEEGSPRKSGQHGVKERRGMLDWLGDLYTGIPCQEKFTGHM